MCEHLKPLESYLQSKRIPETYRGQPWSDNCREWVYFDCVLDTEALKSKLNLPSSVEIHENTDPRSGVEKGLVCKQCNDAIMGLHPGFPSSAHKLVID